MPPRAAAMICGMQMVPLNSPSALVTITLKSVGNEGKRHGEHGSPSATDEEEGQHKQILVGNERNHGEADGTDDEAQSVSKLLVADLRQNHCPYHATDSLPEE